LLETDIFSLDEDLALLSATAKAAGRIALGFFGRKPQVWMKAGDRSPVSEADFAVDHYCRETLLQARPDYGWISEESTDSRPSANYQRSFVVDPIDGTRGFLQQSPFWCVSVAIIEDGRPLCGVLQCPIEGEQYHVSVTGVAQLNDQPLVRERQAVAQPWRLSCSTAIAKKLPIDLTKKVTLTANIPSLAYRLALLAAGKLDVVLVRPHCHDWDIAAVDLILHRSGCCLTNEMGEKPTYGDRPFAHGFLIAAPQEIHGQITQFFR